MKQHTDAAPIESQPPVAERRRSRRLRLELETAVPVIVREDGCVQWGLVRNLSDGGMLIELTEPPPIGAALQIQIPGVRGSIDAPDAVVLHGEVRHHVAWNFGGEGRGMHAVGVRFSPPPAVAGAVTQ
jgi:hypothetical protein